MPANLNSLKAGWLELESDPGLFTLLLEDFGVKGVQVEEIYDLQKPIESPVYGFIFLFKWIEERRSRRKIIVNEEQYVKDEPVVNSIFFAHQIVPNSCATHALLSVLLNCEKIYLGDTLTRLKEYTKDMSPENKGYAIGNTPELARAHNSHAKPEPRRMKEKLFVITTGRICEAFHFVSYVPINGHLFELDGLKPYPIDHGPWSGKEDWTEKFRRLIADRLGIATSGEPYHDIRFNLMAVVPDRRIAYESKLKTLKINRQIVLEALQQLVKVTNPNLMATIRTNVKPKMPSEKPKSVSKDATSSSVSQPNVPVSTAAPATVVNSTTTTVITADMSVSTSVRCSPVNNSSSAGSIQSNCSTPTILRGTPSRSTSSPYVSHPALVPHNYAKSPLLEGHSDDTESSKLRYEQQSGSEYTSGDEEDDNNDDDDEDNDNEEDGVDNDEDCEDDEDDGLGDFDEADGLEDDDDDGCDEFTVEPQSAPEPRSLFPPPKMIHSGPGSGCPLAPNTTSPIPLRPINVGSKDFSKPLSIQTKFEMSPTPSCSSTDTSSEVGSAFNSPVRSIHFGSAQNSPNFGGFRDFRRLVVIRVGGGAVKDSAEDSPSDVNSNSRTSRDQSQLRYVDPPPPFRGEASLTPCPSSSSSAVAVIGSTRKPTGETNSVATSEAISSSSKKSRLDSSVGVSGAANRSDGFRSGDQPQPSPVDKEVSSSTTDAPLVTSLISLPNSTCLAPFSPSSDPSRYPHLIEPHKFAPKDLLALLKNIENEITACDSTLKDEIEKQKKYKVDDSRRTHNYDNFICTFLSMLDCHGLLADLVEEHISVKRRQGINLGRLHKIKKVDTRRRKPKPRKRK